MNRITLIGMLLISIPLKAQYMPCDRVPGDSPCNDILPASFPDWGLVGSSPQVPDLDGNGVVDILDFVTLGNRDNFLNHGLLGHYWALADGSEGQNISWPDFDNPPYQATLVQPVPEYRPVTNYNGFLNTTMRRNFGVAFTGWLWIPETADYTFSLWGREGIRFFIDGEKVLDFQSWNIARTWSGSLQAGFLPVRIEFFTNDRNPFFSLSWENNGSIIGPGSKTIDVAYLYHRPIEVAENQVSHLDIHFKPESGKRVSGSQSQLDLNAHLISADPDTVLEVNGQPVTLINGTFYGQIDLEPGLNELIFKAHNNRGETIEEHYHVYRDNETLAGPGLMVNSYVTEHYSGIIPNTEELNLQPWNSQAWNSTQLQPDENGRLILDGHYHGAGSILKLNGLIQITTPGWYRFRLQKGGAIEVNGTHIAAIAAYYPRQFEFRGEIYLEAGYHDYCHTVSAAITSPNSNIWWQFGGEDKVYGAESLLPDGIFSHSARHRHPQPNPIPVREGHSRLSDQLVAEYLFRPGKVYGDTSGYGHDLTPDPRIVPIDSGGIQLEQGSSLFSHQAGVHSVAAIVQSQKFSLEIDFILDQPIDNHNSYELLSITNIGLSYPARIRLRNNDLFFSIDDMNGNTQTLRFNNIINDPGRYYIVGTYDGSHARLYINGVLAGPAQAMNLDLSLWPKRSYVAVGSQFTRNFRFQTSNRSIPGRIMAAAIYTKDLSVTDQAHNMAQNLALNPSSGVVPPPQPTSFPPIGTSQTALDEAYHVLNRLTFGPSPKMILDLLGQGRNQWINQQLNPESIDDSQLEQIMNSQFFVPKSHADDLRAFMMFRMAHSNRQLREVMTQFWDNHFNTQLFKTSHRVAEMEETDRFRQHALGNFGDLLMASALNFPMTVYLDNNSNVVAGPNENYAREIMELHTVGVNNGYTQEDIAEVARIFTGWTIQKGAFFFDPGLHDYGAKSAFGLDLPAGGGKSEGIQFIQHLVSLPQTADFISSKLCQLFIADTPPQDVVDAAAATFLNSNGDIKATLITIFNHNRFAQDLTYRMNKSKTPLEFVISLMRATEAFPITTNLPQIMAEMGMSLLEHPDPTGFSEEGVDWIDTNALLLRLNFANDLSMNRGSGHSPGINLRRLLQRYGAQSADEILDLFSAITTHGKEHPGARNLAMEWLTRDDPNFVLTEEQLNTRVRQVLGFYLKLPEMNRQ